MLIISVLRLDYKFKTSLGYIGRLPIYFYPFKATANLGSAAKEPPLWWLLCPIGKQRAMRYNMPISQEKDSVWREPVGSHLLTITQKKSWANQVSVHGVVKYSNKQLAQYQVFPVPALVESRYSHPIIDLATPT